MKHRTPFVATIILVGAALSSGNIGAAAEPTDAPVDTPTTWEASTFTEASGLAEFVLPASGQRSSTVFSDEELLDNSVILGDAAALMGIGNVEAGVPTGFAGVAGDPKALTLTVWWVGGELPDRLTEPVAEQFPQVEIEVRPAAADRNTLESAIATSGVAEWASVDSVATRVDGEGVILTHSPSTPVDAEAAAVEIGFPVVTVEEQPMQGYDSRNWDWSPLRGGALIKGRESDGSLNRPVCSTGFPVKRVWDGNIMYRMTSANHCAFYSGTNNPKRYDYWRRFGNEQGLYDGITQGGISSFPGRDVMLMRSAGNPYGNFVYRGGVDSGSGSASEIVGTYGNFVAGTMLANSGANSGEHLVTIGNPSTITRSSCNGCSMWRVYANNGGVGAAGGDSGGPVIVSGGSAGTVRIAGMIHGGPADEFCNPPLVVVPADCSTEAYISSAASIISHLNANAGGGWAVAY